MFTNSRIILSHEDLEQAIAYWLDSRVFSYDLRNAHKVNLSVETGTYIINFEKLPPKTTTQPV